MVQASADNQKLAAWCHLGISISLLFLLIPDDWPPLLCVLQIWRFGSRPDKTSEREIANNSNIG
jgi:hypothetical protein